MRQASELEGDAWRLWLGKIFYTAKRYNYAEIFLKPLLLEKNSFDQEASIYMARTLHKLQRYDDLLKLTADNPFLSTEYFWLHVEGLSHTHRQKGMLEILKKADSQGIPKAIIAYYRAVAALAQNDKTTLAKQLEIVLTDEAGSIVDEQAAIVLRNQGLSLTSPAQLKRAKNLIDRGLPLWARKIYEHLALQGEDRDFDIAYATFRARHYHEATQLLEQLLIKSDSSVGQVRLMLAQAYARSDQFDKAIALYLQLGTSGSFDIRRKIAFLTFDAGRYSEARALYSQLNPQKPEYAWMQFWSSFFIKDWPKALVHLDYLKKSTSDKGELAKILYWRARVYDKSQKHQTALDLYSELKKNSHNYYSYLAKQRIKGKLNPTRLFDDAILDLPKKESERTHPLEIHAPTPPSLLARGGFFAELKDRMSQSVGGLQGSQAERADFYTQHAQFNALTVLGQQVAKISTTDATRDVWEWAYPNAYETWVDYFCRLHGMDRNLAWSIMRQESAFRPSIVSPALAIGLMQIIPQTAHEIAASLGLKSFHPSHLEDPILNIRFGTWYLKERLKQFDGKLAYVIASYNAGPDAMTRWRRWADHMETDEFIDMIPYDETRTYVKKVLMNYLIYKNLYRDM